MILTLITYNVNINRYDKNTNNPYITNESIYYKTASKLIQ